MSWVYSDQWAAGFFDGEGCVSIQKRQRGSFLEHHLSVQIGQQIPEPLAALAARFGSKVTTKGGYANGQFWRWRVYGRVAEAFLTAIYPHSLVKREEIAAALDLRRCLGCPGQRSTPDRLVAKERAFERWRAARYEIKTKRAA